MARIFPSRQVCALAMGVAMFFVAIHVRASESDHDEPELVVSAHADRILGHWQRGEGEAIIEVSEHNGVYRGFIVWSEKRPETVGVEVFRELRYDPNERSWHGRAYSIKRKREVRIDIAVPKPEALELTAHILFFTKDVAFRRIPHTKLASIRAGMDL